MIAIFPKDNTTHFLYSVVSNISIDYIDVNWISQEEFIINVTESDSGKSIIYLGHGTSDEINTNIGIEMAIDYYEAGKMFYQKKIILVSCYSGKFIEKIKNKFTVALGFGNIPTSVLELSKGKQQDYYEEASEAIEIFKAFIVEIFKNALHEVDNESKTFFDLFNSIKLRINKALSKCVFKNDKIYRLVGELLFDLKKEMLLLGDVSALVNS